MAYDVSNPPVLVCQSIGSAPGVWAYASEDVHTDVDAANYFTNGAALGMRVKDFVMVQKTTATIGATLHCVTAVTSSGATVSPAILA